MAIYAAELEDSEDAGLYATDILTEPIVEPEARTTAVDYVRQAAALAQANIGQFEREYLSDLVEIIDFIPGSGSEGDKVMQVHELLCRHGEGVDRGIRRARDAHDDPFEPLDPRSLLGLVAGREHLKPEIERALSSIVQVVGPAVGEMFREERPKNERDLNQKIGALLRSHESELQSEHPTVSFACAQVVPDHELEEVALLIEAKFIRRGTSPSKVSEGMASDLTKYPQDSNILFLVYDPDHAIPSDRQFRESFEGRGRCKVEIIR